MKSEEKEIQLTDVEETGLLTLYCKAVESLSDSPILLDKQAIEAVKRLDPILKRSQSPLLQMLAARKIDPRLVTHIALRARKYDAYAQEFLEKAPRGLIVNMGCGMDTRFFRIDNGTNRFIDVDLPAMISFKRKLFKENQRYQMIANSIFETGWMELVERIGAKNVMFQAEGVFMYLEPEKVRQLVLALQTRFPGCELICEVVRKQWTGGIWKKMVSMKMGRQLGVGKNAGYCFGLENPHEMETWHTGIQFLDQWSYFDSDHKRLGAMRMFKHSKYLRESQYTVHYRLN